MTHPARDGERRPAGADELSRLQAALEVEAARVAPGRSRGRRNAIALAVGVAIGLALGWHFLRRRSPPTPGADTIELVEPLGAVERYGAFRWRADTSPGRTFELQIETDPEDGVPELVLAPATVTACEWSPLVSQADRLPNRIRWEVRSRAADGTVLQASGRAWLEPR